MKITHDKKAQATYVYITNKPITNTVVNGNVNVDYDEYGKVVGVEILNVTEPKIQIL